MSCKNKTLLEKISNDKIDKFTEVAFAILSDLDDCKRISVDRYVNINGSMTFNRFKKPVNRFECDSEGCLSGTGYFSAGAVVTYRVPFDATEFASGVLTLYAIPTANLKVSLSDTATFTDADEYNVSVNATDALDDGFAPIVIDLSKTPSNVKGNGWTASTAGAFIQITSETAFTISSITVHDSMEDFLINDVVKVGCLTGIDGTEDIEAAEATCRAGGYNTQTAPSFTRTVTGGYVTPNYRKLNPVIGKGEKVKGFVNETVDMDVVADGDYGIVRLPDMADECAWVYAAVNDGCTVTDNKLERLSVPALVDIADNQFIVIRDSEGNTTLYFNKALVGTEVRISYPKAVDIAKEFIADIDNANGKRTRMSYMYRQSDGKQVMRVYNNVLVTSFPVALSNEETQFAFTITIQVDSENHYYREWIIAD